jgi:putative OPT family oligopeptide transporter
MSTEPQVMTKLPENAYRELKPGETYVPMVPPSVSVPEITTRSIIFGIAMNIIFSVVATYLALKAGQGIETAIPISILAIGLSGVLVKFGLRRSSLLENINILAISTTSGIVAGGTCFTMPAIYVLKLNEKLGMGDLQLFLQIFLVPFFGAILGVLFLIPFRRYFVKEMHGKLPFPEATATNEILATGAGGGGQAWVLIYSFLLAMVYNFLSKAMNLFTDVFTTGKTTLEYLVDKAGVDATTGKATFDTAKEAVDTLAFKSDFITHMTEKIKTVFFMGTGAYYLGLGFIIGLRYAAIICAGSFLSWFVIVPLLGQFDLDTLHILNAHPKFTETAADRIFYFIPRNIGIGGIFAAGIISILKMSKVIVTALSQALGGLFKAKGAGAAHDRTEHDMSYSTMLILGLLTTIAMALYFRFAVLANMPNPTQLTIIATVLALGVTFLFTTVSAWAIAMISTTPISGMTVTTIIITAAALLAAGLEKGDAGMLATLLVGGVVCTALSMSGTLVTEFKLAYWLGATPRKIQWSAIIAALLASAAVTGTIMLLAKSEGFVPTAEHAKVLSAPQANMMASAIEGFLGKGGQVPWLLYATGAVVSIILQMLGVSPLAFALGMYLPMEINTSILLGAFIAWLVGRGAKNEGLAKARSDKSILVASGLIAGAAIVEVLVIVFSSLIDKPLTGGKWMLALDMSARRIAGGASPEALAQMNNWVGVLAFLALCLFVYVDCRRARPEKSGA